MPSNHDVDIDEIDAVILKILASDPRAPYTDIAQKVEEAGFELSGEGVRYRVQRLIDVTKTFFFIDLEQVSGEIVRIAVTTTDEEGAKDRTFQELSDMQFWHITRGVGTYDIYAVGLTSTMREMDGLLTSIRELDSVESVEHVLSTERTSSIDAYIDGFRKGHEATSSDVDADESPSDDQ